MVNFHLCKSWMCCTCQNCYFLHYLKNRSWFQLITYLSLLISLQIISPNIHEKWYYYYLIFSFKKKKYFSILLTYFVLLIWFVVTIEKCFGERNNIISTYGPWLVTSWQGQIFTTFFIECLLNFLISIFNAAYLVERLHFWVSDSKKSILFCSGLLLDHSSQFKNWCMTKKFHKKLF